MDKEEVKRRYLEISVMRFLIKQQIDDINNWFIADAHSRGLIPNAYSCQKCGNMLITETEVNVFPGFSPLCMGCLGNITITKEAIDEYIEKHYKEEESGQNTTTA